VPGIAFDGERVRSWWWPLPAAGQRQTINGETTPQPPQLLSNLVDLSQVRRGPVLRDFSSR
jgi:hypothetical protein